jgi:hypothetical protein
MNKISRISKIIKISKVRKLTKKTKTIKTSKVRIICEIIKTFFNLSFFYRTKSLCKKSCQRCTVGKCPKEVKDLCRCRGGGE